MGDLNSLQASDTIKIAGASSTGSETNFVNASENGDMQTADIMNTDAVNAIVGLTTSATVLRVGVSNLQNRKYLVLQALDVGITWGFSSSVMPFDLLKNQVIMIPCGSNINVYAQINAGTGNIAVGELS